MAGVELIREQIESALEPGVSYELCENGLRVRFDRGASPLSYDLRYASDGSSSAVPYPAAELGELDRERLAFFASPVTWELWVEVWDRDQTGGRYTPRLVIGANLLPWAVKPVVQPL